MTIMLRVIVLISYVVSYLLVATKYYKYLSEGTFIETIWSMVPAFLLVILVLPSMKVLYIVEDVKTPAITLKVVAHQWYWSYVVPVFKNFSFSYGGSIFGQYEYDSLLEEFSFSSDFPRLLGCSSDLFLPLHSSCRFLISSTDVIHSFAVPSLGLKVDALPGRINQLFANPSRMGWFYGQCSEICGSNHTFMPISIKVLSLSDYDLSMKSYFLTFLSETLSFDSVKMSFSFS